MPYVKAISMHDGVLAKAGGVRLSIVLLLVVAFSLPVAVLVGPHAPFVRNAIVAASSILSAILSLRERRGWGGPFVTAFILLSAFSLVSVLWAFNIGVAYSRLIDLFLAVLLGVAIAANGPSLRDIHLILNGFLIGLILVSAVSLWMDRATLSGWARLGSILFESAGSNIIEYSCMLIYAQMYAAYRMLMPGRNVRWGAAFCLLFVCGLLTGIRKALVIPLLFIYVYLLIRNRRDAVKIVGVTALIGALAVLVLFLVNQYFTSLGSRLMGLLNDILSGAEAASSGGNSYEERMWLRQTAWQAFLEKPVLGLGVGQFRLYSVAHGGPNLYAHNNYLELLANLGFIGFVLYYGAIFLMLRAIWKGLNAGNAECSRFCTFGVAFIVAILVMEYGQVDYYQSYFLIFPFLISSFTQSLLLTRSKRDDNY